MKNIVLILFFTLSLMACSYGTRIEQNSEQNMVYYFAYGSNMSSKRLNERIDVKETIGKASLNHYELIFTSINSGIDHSGKCNLVEKEHSTVWGVLYKIDAQELLKLDAFEGAPNHYKQERIVVSTDDGTYNAITYVATQTENKPSQPYEWYYNHVYKGALEHHLPKEYLTQYIFSVSTQADTDESRDYTERLIYE